MSNDFVLTNSQKTAFDAMVRGENVFLTGGAGTGKTTVIKKFIETTDPNCTHTLLAAPTGKAAINMSIKGKNGTTICGSTVHRLFGIKAVTCPEYKGNIPKILKATKTIIIDEISMMRIDIFDYVMNAILDENAMRDDGWLYEKEQDPIQIILVGDFFQLPPVVRTRATEGLSDKEVMDKMYGFDVGKGYCFQSPLWELLNIKMYELTEIMRQKDDEDFCIALNKIRIGDASGVDYINEHYNKERPSFSWITLCGTNESVNRINGKAMEMNENPKSKYIREVKVDSSFKGNADGFLKDLPCEESLTLFVGARVICIVNCESGINGMMGEVVELMDDGVVVKWDDTNTKAFVQEYKWEVTKQEIIEKWESGKTKRTITSKSVLSVSQLPLKLAYAITVHKAQGETLKKANINTDTFETGHLYTALSRCESVTMMKLRRQLTAADVKHDQTINNFYKKEREVNKA